MSKPVTAPKPVTARPHPGWIPLSAAMAGLVIALVLSAPDSRWTDPVMWILVAAFGAMTLVVAAWVAGTSVRADDAGLAWRSWWRRRTVPWSGVRDYYLRLARQARRPAAPAWTIETVSGRIVVTEAWRGGEALSQEVCLRATAAHARDWQLLGTRPQDRWPRTFTYDVRACRRSAWLMAGLGAAYAAALLVPAIARAPREADPVAWGLFAGMLVMMLVPVGGMALVCWVAVVPYRDAARRGSERIVTDPAGITFTDGARRIAVPWSGVREVTRVRAGRLGVTLLLRLSTDAGDIEYTGAIADVALLNAIVERYAPADRYRTSDEAPDEAPGSVRVYTYRNPTVRALLMFPAGLAICSAVKAAVDAAGLTPHPGVTGDLVLTAGLAIAWLWLWWRYRTVSVRIDPLGTAWCGPGRRKRIPWAELRSVRLVLEPPYRFCVVEGGRERISFWMGITAAEELHGEIAARLAERDAVVGRPRPAVR